MGPKRDIVGQWQKAAKKQGLRFGVSEHLGASFTWFQTSHGADKTGPMAGVPYDGADPKYQDLYHPRGAPRATRHGTAPIRRGTQEWFAPHQGPGRSAISPTCSTPTAALPFGEVGRSMLAHFYNSNIERARRQARGRLHLQGHRTTGEFVAGTCVQDMERGVLAGINPLPWQTDTSIGDWFYNNELEVSQGRLGDPHAGRHRQQERQPAAERRAAPRRQSLDPEVEQMLDRSWAIGWRSTARRSTARGRGGLRRGRRHGQGRPLQGGFRLLAQGHPLHDQGRKTLYAIALGWPTDRKARREVAGQGARNWPRAKSPMSDCSDTTESSIGRVPTKGLTITLPEKKPCDFAFALKIALAP